MPSGLTVTEVLRTGVQREIESQKLYTELGGMVRDTQAKYVFTKLVREEKRHQDILERFLAGGIQAGMLKPDEVLDYRVAESLNQPAVKPDMALPDIFLLAANREKMAMSSISGWRRPTPLGSPNACC